MEWYIVDSELSRSTVEVDCCNVQSQSSVGFSTSSASSGNS